jgi:hypothetical protein
MNKHSPLETFIQGVFPATSDFPLLLFIWVLIFSSFVADDTLSLSMSFGFSVGDFLAGANLAYRLIRALSETRGARMEYQEVIDELGCIQQTFLQVEHMSSSNIFCQATINAISHIMNSSIDVMARFLEQTEKYRQSLSSNGGQSLAAESWRKIGWSLFKKEELTSLRDTLQTRLTAINILVSTASR